MPTTVTSDGARSSATSGRDSAASSASSIGIACCARIARASRVEIGTVGPEATSSGCPGTSSATSVTTSALLAAASRPPLIDESAARTTLSDLMSVPASISVRAMWAIVSIDTPAAGSSSIAEPPPDTSTSSVPSGAARAASVSASRA